MQVELMSHTAKPKEVIYASARQCYSKYGAWEVFNKSGDFSQDKLNKFIEHLFQRGHLSPLEHVSFTFAIDGVSRACTHQLVRHRIASYSQQSQRYVSMQDCEFVIPPVIEKDSEARTKYNEIIDYIKRSYDELRNIMQKNTDLDKESINQDIRFILPNAACTKIVVTMNVRELIHFFAERMCLRAQWEIRIMAGKMYNLCKTVLPEIFTAAGAKCRLAGKCPEGMDDCPMNPKKNNIEK
ncbi:MAG: FAD-dependent thymidylate synthase [Candidatus Omnitrophica bacterium]|nr:FAD-dependent thymidylate synthase [Candidatus Omnitrophota bacterium]MDD5441558.1 FAD-dependent thymidylate synthase [Candidatus Omnitrophota bacterium]